MTANLSSARVCACVCALRKISPEAVWSKIVPQTGVNGFQQICIRCSTVGLRVGAVLDNGFPSCDSPPAISLTRGEEGGIKPTRLSNSSIKTLKWCIEVAFSSISFSVSTA